MTSDSIERVKRGDRDAIDTLLARNMPRLARVASGLLGERLRGKARPSDLLQSALVEALASLPDFRGHSEAEFVQWMVRILENTVRDAGRFFRADRRTVEREVSGPDLELRSAGEPSPPARALMTEQLVAIGQAMQRLPRDYRRVLLMRLTQERSHEDIGRALGRSAGAARVLFARARAALALELHRRGVRRP